MAPVGPQSGSFRSVDTGISWQAGALGSASVFPSVALCPAPPSPHRWAPAICRTSCLACSSAEARTPHSRWAALKQGDRSPLLPPEKPPSTEKGGGDQEGNRNKKKNTSERGRITHTAPRQKKQNKTEASRRDTFVPL